jgi:hypothetical protein
MRKLLLITAAVMVSIATAQADIITVTAIGTVSSGYDYTGVFGLVGDLTSSPYTATYVFDTSLGSGILFFDTSTQTHFVSPPPSELYGQVVYGGGMYGLSSTPGLSTTLTVNGHDVGISSDHYGMLATLYDHFAADATTGCKTPGPCPYASFVTTNLWGSFNDFPASFDSITFNVGTGASQYGQFQISNGPDGPLNAYGSFYTDTITISNSTVSVPGPVVGAGLPGLGAMSLLWLARRRRNRNRGGC